MPKETDAMVRALESEEEEPSEESEEEDEVERPPFCMKLNHNQPRAQEESEDHDYRRQTSLQDFESWAVISLVPFIYMKEVCLDQESGMTHERSSPEDRHANEIRLG